MSTRLYEIAHSRAGDKGDTLILSLIPYRDSDYIKLCETVTVDRFKAHFKEIIRGEVTRYELPNISALQFVSKQSLAGGVTTSMAMDTHGKTLSYAFLEMEI